MSARSSAAERVFLEDIRGASELSVSQVTRSGHQNTSTVSGDVGGERTLVFAQVAN